MVGHRGVLAQSAFVIALFQPAHWSYALSSPGSSEALIAPRHAFLTETSSKNQITLESNLSGPVYQSRPSVLTAQKRTTVMDRNSQVYEKYVVKLLSPSSHISNRPTLIGVSWNSERKWLNVLLCLKGLFHRCLGFTYAAVRHFDFTIGNGPASPDGFERQAILVNGQFPGPAITVQKGDSVVIPTHNKLINPGMRRSTSIHWHGFFQPRTSAQDGPAFVNQCPIPPNTTFTYSFSTAPQTGNFWYHSHLSTQYCDGLRGIFVVYDPNDPLKHLYDVDDASTLITLADWYHNLAPAAQNVFFQTGVVPIPDSGLINGRGRFNGGPLVPFAVVNVQRGRRYRLRVFAISCRPFFTFSIDNHNITFMEADGIEHDPVTVQNVDVYAAQRVSVILNANQPIGNYWIRAPPTGGAPAGNPNFNPDLTRAILRYRGAPAVEPTTNNTPGPKLLDQQMHPIASEHPGMLGDGPPDVAITLNIAQPNPPFFDINGISYISPSVPVLLQLLSGAAQPQDLLPSEQVFILPKNKLIEVSIPGGGAHPFHLHGHAFDVVRPGNDNNTNFVNPLRRDVYPINGGNTTFRFFSGNPGAWFLHCHIDWHLEAGLAIVFGEAPEDNVSGPQAQITPQDWLNLCPEYDALAPDFQ